MLEILFHHCDYFDKLSFKGGASLLKAYGIIKRFSVEALIQEIRLEIGSLVAWTPLTNRVITPYVAEEFPNIFQISNTLIRTVDAKRTFWEKATILYFRVKSILKL